MFNVWKEETVLFRKCHAGCGSLFGCKTIGHKEWSIGNSMSWRKVEECYQCDSCPRFAGQVERCDVLREIKKEDRKYSPDGYCPECIEKKLNQKRD